MVLHRATELPRYRDPIPRVCCWYLKSLRSSLDAVKTRPTTGQSMMKVQVPQCPIIIQPTRTVVLRTNPPHRGTGSRNVGPLDPVTFRRGSKYSIGDYHSRKEIESASGQYFSLVLALLSTHFAVMHLSQSLVKKSEPLGSEL
jgi:hypothetical protein